MKKCSWCGYAIPESEEYYERYGNCCLECDSMFNKMSTGIMGYKDNKWGSKSFCKLRSYTEKEKESMFAIYLFEKGSSKPN